MDGKLDGSTKWPVFVLVALCAAAYLPFVGGGMLTDDFLHLTKQQSNPTLLDIVTSPDPFRFYRPVVQASFWLNSQIFGVDPVYFRVVNLLLHLGVVIAVYLLGRKLLDRPRAALLATLAFALTPKAHPIAVLWISARNDVLMALFSLLAVLAWIRWDGTRRVGWLAASGSAYLLAALSKETAIFLPLLLLLTPGHRSALAVHRIAGVAVMFIGGAIVFAMRSQVGALMPTTFDSHYGLVRPIARWLRNAENYVGRAIPSAIGMLAVVGLPAWLHRRRTATRWSAQGLGELLIFAVAWFAVFMVPVLPIVARSELYLYMPAIGICLLTGAVVDRLLDDEDSTRRFVISLGVYILIFGGYQVSRNRGINDALRFSAELMQSLRAELETYSGPVLIRPADPVTAQLLSDSVGGYGDVVLKMATGRYEVNGVVDYGNEVARPDALTLVCSRDGGKVRCEDTQSLAVRSRVSSSEPTGALAQRLLANRQQPGLKQ